METHRCACPYDESPEWAIARFTIVEVNACDPRFAAKVIALLVSVGLHLILTLEFFSHDSGDML